jgi:hypothetical protein
MIFDFLTAAIKPVTDLIDNLSTSDKERGELKNQMISLENQMQSKLLDYETKLLDAQSSIITAEAKGESWIQRNWRPLTMLTFTALIVSRWMGFSAPNITPDLEMELFSIVKLGLGGYVIGRSLEKAGPAIAGALKK